MKPFPIEAPAQPDAGAISETPPASRRSRLQRALLRTSLAAAAGSAALAVYVGVLAFTTPGVDELRQVQGTRASVILSSDGEVIGRFAAAYQAPVALKDVSPDLVHALLATEDHASTNTPESIRSASSPRSGTPCMATCRVARR